MSGFAVVAIDFENQWTMRILEVANSWGGMPVIWDLFAICYGKDPRQHSYKEILESLSYQIEIDEAAPKSFEFVLRMTDERAFVEAKDFDRLISDLDEFFNSVPPREDKYVNHWPEIMETLRMMTAEQAPAIGFYSSVVGDVWRVDDEDANFRLKPEDFRNVYGSEWPEVQ